jgi:hypothetical protein
MTVHTFAIVLDHEPTDVELDALYEAGCDDAGISIGGGQARLSFDREGASLAEAIAGAVRGIEQAGLVPRRVADQDLLTLQDIADRVGRSREAVRRWAAGDLGPGGFPPPVNAGRGPGSAVFYRWSEVAPWIRERLGVDVPDVDTELVAANLLLQARPLVRSSAHADSLRSLLAA